MTTTRATTAMIEARRASAADKEHAAHKAIAALTRRHESLTITAVAIEAGVSRSYLSRHRVLSAKIRAAAGTAPVRLEPAASRPTTVEAALRHHVRTLQKAHDEQVARLRNVVRALERENAHLRGELISCGRHTDVEAPTNSQPQP